MSQTTIDHDEIRRWAESKGGKPAAVDRTHHDGDVGIIRIMFPDAAQSQHGSLVEISWDEFFAQFDEAELALIYDEKSLFSKLVGRDTVEKREHGDNHAARHEDRRPDGKANGGHRATRSADGDGERNRSQSRKGEDDDLKSREYRDEDGTVHHHTRAYMKEHGR